MRRVSIKHANEPSDLRQHFHNYFELLLGAERSKLQQSIVSVGGSSERNAVLIEIDCRIDYLRGAMRMGKLLCLIDQEEAKTNFGRLSLERDLLRNSVLAGHDNVPQAPESRSRAARIDLIKRSIRPIA